MQLLPTTGLHPSTNKFLSKNSSLEQKNSSGLSANLWDVCRKIQRQRGKMLQVNLKGAALKVKGQLSTGENPKMKAC